MSLAIVFCGQGLQHPAMLPWLDDEGDGMGAVASRFGKNWRTLLADPAEAGRNVLAQPLLTALALAAWTRIRNDLPEPAVSMGYSVGELAAAAASGAIDADTAVTLAERRAALMDASSAGTHTGLMSISGIGAGNIEDDGRLVHGVHMAIRLDDSTVIVGGPIDALQSLESAMTARGCMARRLNIAVASHTPWMARAASGFASVLEGTHVQAPQIPIVSNFTSMVTRSAADLRRNLAGQIDHCIRWDACEDTLDERRITCVLEIGAGSALARHLAQRHPHIAARAADEFRSRDALLRWAHSHGHE